MKIIKEREGLRALITKELGLTSGTVYQWREVPRQHVPAVARVTGLSIEELMPDVFASPAPAASDKPKGRAA